MNSYQCLLRYDNIISIRQVTYMIRKQRKHYRSFMSVLVEEQTFVICFAGQKSFVFASFLKWSNFLKGKKEKIKFR